jgi:hypothetical protein
MVFLPAQHGNVIQVSSALRSGQSHVDMRLPWRCGLAAFFRLKMDSSTKTWAWLIPPGFCFRVITAGKTDASR